MPARLSPASGDLRLNGCLLNLDPATGRARSIERLQIPHVIGATATARRLSGDEPAAALRGAARVRLAELRASGAEPRLALLSVGEDAASAIYLKRKTEACLEVGIEPHRVTLPAGTDTRAVIEKVRSLGADPAVSGILVQLPLAAPADADAVLEAVPPHKDVDGFHPVNAGRLAAGLPGFVPATPRGVLELLRYYEVPLAGRHAVVLGRSNIVGRPLATLLSSKRSNMTVTLGHSGSGPRLKSLANTADLLIAAIGRPEFVDATWVRRGATVVDVGIHRVADPDAPKGSRLTGDVAPDVATVAAALTPVPGGVGPMTVAALMANVVQAVESQRTGAGAGAPR
ncbi:MAG: bifunctional 5,10-methylene-tetrahydrofolate dehydrogenase/5,10-methylene-tetrahydrofolate cyclohydrolase [Candidatus Eisenbacteria bacterium]|uniref:Bifunctional protein FolD n=1 Tax=Eiseniibacteriota bacterium TaxID=2212470 RepID=A0A849SID3_UNCEI|nr:bifunctional 5,10-methylene-tetrahydrofolate dehydrogenase/5,10-methylene-tetrahydrofolate cyclohydrolase [Candidatus Eisenbacteria bacterium]